MTEDKLLKWEVGMRIWEKERRSEGEKMRR
jgi:hypothetical protein